MIIIIHAHNSIEYTKLTLETLRSYGPGYPVVLIDNASDDGMKEWASAQEDITYVYMDEGYQPIGKALNEVIRALSIEEDLLIIDGHMAFTPGMVEAMEAVFAKYPNTGAVGPMCNAQVANQEIRISTDKSVADYNDAIVEAMRMERESERGLSDLVVGLSDSALMIKKPVWDEVGGFDEEMEDFHYVAIDYSLRILPLGYECRVAKGALIWDIRVGRRSYVSEKDRCIMAKKHKNQYLNIVGNKNITEKIDRNKDDEFNVLEIGCDCGATLLAIRNEYPNVHCYGAEINPASAEIASYVMESRDNVVVANIDDRNLDFGVKFDYVLFGDVLEHLRDPLGTLQFTKTLLNDGGMVLASIPNLMNITVIEDLLNGNFTYTDTGLLDRTHIHLFTYNEIVKMFEEAGYSIRNMTFASTKTSEEQDEFIGQLLKIAPKAEEFMYKAFQYVVEAKKI